MDGLYEIRYGYVDAATPGVVKTDEFWSKVNAFLESPGTAGTSGEIAGLQALGLDATTCATVTERGNISYVT